MEKTDVLVIGGSAAGLVAAATGKSHYPDKDFLVIRKDKQAMIPCGIPYVFGSIESTDKNILPDALATNSGVRVKIDEVVSIDRTNKVCHTKDDTEISFEKLVFATGSTPKIPKWLKGANIENVFTIPKNKEYLDDMILKLKNCNTVVTIGGGFIGVEVSDELKKSGKEVTIVEVLPRILSLAFDGEIAVKAEEILVSNGIKIHTGIGVDEILGNGTVTGVRLTNGEIIDADAVVLSTGYQPNTVLAENADLKTNDMGFIRVDEYMRTEDSDIFAVGDCAEKRNFATRKTSNVMLASTACAEARIAGMNLFILSAVKTFSGTIAIFSTCIDGTGFGAAGLTENQAINEGFDIVTGTFEGIDRHPGTLTDTHKQTVKLIVARESGVILGGEVVGGLSAGELINVIGLAIQNRMTINSILTTQIGTQPLLTASPAAYPIIKAAEVVAQHKSN
jgi:NADH oxidase (H2O2-forming)